MLVCYDCGLPYCSPAWADVVVPDAVWLEISPTGDDGGVLCFRCMNLRLITAGYGPGEAKGCVDAKIRSGPMADVS